jgi:predicted small secreted protein
MATAPSRPPRILSALLLTLVTTIAGCSTAGFSGQDVQLRTSGDTLYVLARSQGVSRNFCASLGGDVARAEGRWAATEGRTMQLGRVAGCHTVRHIIVCSDEDGACLVHEERHKVEGAFHR